MRCGVCHAPLRVLFYRSVEIASGIRRVPLCHPCPNLDDPERHPARLQTKKKVVLNEPGAPEPPSGAASASAALAVWRTALRVDRTT